MDHLLDDGLAVAIEVHDKVLEAFRAVEGFRQEIPFLVRVTLVSHGDRDALVQVGQFTHPIGEGVVAVHQRFEDFGIRLELDRGASLVCGANLAHSVLLLAPGVFLLVHLASAVNFGAQACGQCVHARHTHTVKTS